MSGVFELLILPLGVGGAFSQKYYHSNLLIQCGQKHLLVDAGTTISNSMAEAQISSEQIEYIFITHFHHDHAGGLAELLTKCYWRFIEGKHVPHRPVLLIRPGQESLFEGLLSPSLNNQGLTWRDYCKPTQIQNLSWGNGLFDLNILPTDDLHCEGMPSCALKITELATGLSVLITGDIKKLEKSHLALKTDMGTRAIIQDTSFLPNSVHCTMTEILSYYPERLHPLIYGIHYEDHIDISETHPINLARQGHSILI